MRHQAKLTFVVAVWVVGCSTGGGTSGGCAALAPIPGTAGYTGPKTDNTVNLQLSPEGINYVNANWRQLVGLFAPGETLTLPIPCDTTNVSVVGNIVYADQGDSNGASANGRLNGNCTGDVPAQVRVTITDFNLTPVQGANGGISGSISVTIDTGRIYVNTENDNHIACLGLAAAKCSLRYNTAAQSPNTNTVGATIRFSIDQRWDKRLALRIDKPLRGTQVCGSMGAQARPNCLDADDIDIDGENLCGDILCFLASWDALKELILQLVSPALQGQIETTIEKQLCQQCGTGLPACPRIGNVQSTCTDGVCNDAAMNRCVPRFLGVEGRVGLGTTMSAFGVPANAALDMALFAGASFSVDSTNAINLGTRGGLAAVEVAPCVAPAPLPDAGSMSVPAFRAEAPPVSPTNPAYHMALGVSSPFINQAFHQAHQGGVLCLNLSSATVGLLNTGLFKTFLPSLGKLTTRDGKDAPMLVVLRPGSPPEAKVGAGGTSPLITLTMKNVSIDFYASIDDRYARLFTLKLGINLPLSMTFSGCTKVTPAIGELKNVITKPDGTACTSPADCVETSNSEILAEDPKVLADLIPAVIGLAEPALASALAPIDLPDLGPFKLRVNAAKGINQIGTSGAFEHLALYATMMPTGMACATLAPRVTAELKNSLMPTAEEMRLKGQPLVWPTAVIAVSALGVPGTPEYQVRIDNGLWSEFKPANSAGELWVSHPSFLLQGLHKIEVQGRVAEAPHGVGVPMVVPFMVDWEAPELSFTLDRRADRLVLKAHDVITPADKLEYSYRVGEGAWSSYGAAREIQLSAIEVQGGVTARVRDQQGNVGERAWRVPTLSERPRADEPDVLAAPAEQGSGCSTAAGLPLLLAFAAVLSRRFKNH
ncbi:MAG: hypothetical protein JNK82_34870 [Myxococcaceae bacterium]|nr:hypothetical protein [Myxococcaceae bacterium]